MRALGRHPRWGALDAVFACLLAADFIVEGALAPGLPSGGRWPTVIAAVPLAAPVAVRRRWPHRALLAAMFVALIQQLFGGQAFMTLPGESAVFVPILCSYGVGAWTETRRGSLVLGVSVVMLYGVGAIATVQQAAESPGWGGSAAMAVFFLLPSWAAGCLVRERSRRAEAFMALERAALTERAERERAAVAEERVLIGRELQDIVAHSVSVMVVQAGGARRLLGEQPDRARESLLAVEHTGREALAEMRRLLGVLRRDDDPRALTPQPGLAQLDELTEQMRARGLPCELDTDPAQPLTPGIDLVAYRVIEAALAQAISHGGRSAHIQIRNGTRALRLEVKAAEAGPVALADLRAVSKRVALYDGQLEVDDAEGRLVVRCQLPLGVPVAA